MIDGFSTRWKLFVKMRKMCNLNKHVKNSYFLDFLIFHSNLSSYFNLSFNKNDSLLQPKEISVTIRSGII